MAAIVALGLGSNQGDRAFNLRRAIAGLQASGWLRSLRTSPLVESAALLKPGAPADWDLPFLNMVVTGESDRTPRELLELCQRLEREAGRGDHQTWAPRPLDIDILTWENWALENGAWGNGRVNEPDLVIPHREIRRRSFVLDPWCALEPARILELGGPTLLELRRSINQKQPLLMAIVNVTPDSFSDGGLAFTEDALEARLQAVLRDRPSILDFGGQSTRPGAEIVGLDEEWRRIERALLVLEPIRRDVLRPWISIDTFRPEIAERAIDWGVEIINDVSGLGNPRMRELARASARTKFVFMHHLGIPADRDRHLPPDRDPVAELVSFAQDKRRELEDEGIDPSRLIFDPGIGFGKRARQSLALVSRARELVDKLPDLPLLFGHSRKSYQKQVDPDSNSDRDAITLVHSLQLAEAGAEILRVHDVRGHRSALLARDHSAIAALSSEPRV